MAVVRFLTVWALALCLQSGLVRADDMAGAGSTFVAPLLARWSADYAVTSRPGLSYQRIGSGAGISSLRAGAVDFAATDAPLSASDLKRFGFLQFPFVVGGIVPVLNLDGVQPGELRLTGDVIADIFMGSIAKWNHPRIAELNPGIKLPAASIIVAHRVDASGTTFNLTNYLSKVSAEWRGRVGQGLSVPWPVGVGGKGNDGVASFVKQTRNSIGYVDFAYARRGQLTYALVRNRAGTYAPPGIKAFEAAIVTSDWNSRDDFNVVVTDSAAEDAYPIAATSFALMYSSPRTPLRARMVVDFFRWGLQHGRPQALELGYVALPPAVVSQIEEYWKSRFSDPLLVSKNP